MLLRKSEPSERIVNVVSDKRGVLVPVPDFDLLMVVLGEKMGISFQDQEIDRRAKVRMTRYRSRIRQLVPGDSTVESALYSILDRSGDLWSWMAKAWFEKDQKRRGLIYCEAIKLFPKSAQLRGSFAVFLFEMLDKHDKVEEHFQKAIELDPTDALNTGNYAEFLLVCGRFEEAAKKLEEAKILNEGRKNQLAAALELNTGILARINAQDDTQALTALSNLLSEGFSRSAWVFTNLLKFVDKKCSPKDKALYSALAASILDPQQQMPDMKSLLEKRSGLVRQMAVTAQKLQIKKPAG